jgi:hypothetical protein
MGRKSRLPRPKYIVSQGVLRKRECMMSILTKTNTRLIVYIIFQVFIFSIAAIANATTVAISARYIAHNQGRRDRTVQKKFTAMGYRSMI